ncbi:hypothetical protein AW736_00035 [Termitidicoccus mucosus]|uniref:Uncharacterized protein n=1 Tax=Termitidicoccus mucosus TaxID=1184151 RepID=A0A178IK52_9BACT|nr:hypothetical protein AW736_26740 [Opitutaceae bacterium TSB47]OAM91243.1 hypothetical protein AW736_00035 [Opitutaceae bacterium TSB47]
MIALLSDDGNGDGVAQGIILIFSRYSLPAIDVIGNSLDMGDDDVTFVFMLRTIAGIIIRIDKLGRRGHEHFRSRQLNCVPGEPHDRQWQFHIRSVPIIVIIPITRIIIIECERKSDAFQPTILAHADTISYPPAKLLQLLRLRYCPMIAINDAFICQKASPYRHQEISDGLVFCRPLYD